MLGGSVAGGFIAQATNLGVPYILRALVLAVTFVFASTLMRDLGFTPNRSKHPIKEVRSVLSGSIEHGLRNPPVRWIMLAAPFTGGVTIYAFYAMQPYLLELFGDPTAYGIAGLAAAMVAGAQILGGLAVRWVRQLFTRRTHALILGGILTVALLAGIGLTDSFPLALVLLAAWCLVFAMETPMRQAFINGIIPSQQRATVLSFDALMGSSGGVVIQPALGRTADVFGYGTSYVVAAGIQALAVPFAILARRENAASDPITSETDEVVAPVEGAVESEGLGSPAGGPRR
jgi:MFS family permease